MGYDRFGRYVLHECLGAGGMAAVHRATVDIGGGVIREVALKRLLPQLADDKKLVDDFIREARIAAQLHHPNIVRILELGRSSGVYFIAMELVQGHSLLSVMKHQIMKDMQTPIGVVVSLLVELCDALDYASNASDTDGEPLHIVHRDLSPSNLIVTDDGHLKIIDFGVAKALSGKFMTSSGMVKGKFGYMSMEALQGKALDRRADIFSVGVVAWELVTGMRLFKAANDYEVVNMIQRGAREPPSVYNRACPPELDEIVMRAVAKHKDERWPNAAVMRRTLDSLRRTYRDGPGEVAAWMHAVVPEPAAGEISFVDSPLSYSLASGDEGDEDAPSIVVEAQDPFAEPSVGGLDPSIVSDPPLVAGAGDPSGELIDEQSYNASQELSGSFASPLELSVSYAAPRAAQLGFLRELDDEDDSVQPRRDTPSRRTGAVALRLAPVKPASSAVPVAVPAELSDEILSVRLGALPDIPESADFSITPFVDGLPPIDGESVVMIDGDSLLVTEAPAAEPDLDDATAFVHDEPFRDNERSVREELYRDETSPMKQPGFDDFVAPAVSAFVSLGTDPGAENTKRRTVSRPPSTLAKRSKEQKLRDTVESATVSEDFDSTTIEPRDDT